MKYFKVVLCALSVILFVSNYQICEFLYPDDLKSWWECKGMLYSFIFLFLAIVAYEPKQYEPLRFVILNFILLSAGNIVSRAFSLTDFVVSDGILLFVSMVFCALIIKWEHIHKHYASKGK